MAARNTLLPRTNFEERHRAARQAVFFSGMLLPISLLPSIMGVAGTAYLAVAVTLGLGLVWLSIRFAADRDLPTARMLFLGSITYLPLIWATMILDH